MATRQDISYTTTNHESTLRQLNLQFVAPDDSIKRPLEQTTIAGATVDRLV